MILRQQRKYFTQENILVCYYFLYVALLFSSKIIWKGYSTVPS